jgi:DNA primase
MSSEVDQIKERLSVADVIGGYVKLEKSGANFKAKCPFHNEKTPSFFVSPDRGSYYCFGCGAKGDVFSFVQAFEGVDFRGALKTLAERAGVELKKRDRTDDTRKERLYAAIEAAADFFQAELVKDPIAHSYVTSRGITDKTMHAFRIGYAPLEWRMLRNHLEAKKFNTDELVAAGLLKRNEKGDAYDVFRGRVMFPIADSSGRIVAFSGRTLDEKENPPKYLNTPETELYSKSRTLFGLDKAKSSIRSFDHAILVEGQMDLVMSHQAGFTNTVAVSGTALSENAAEESASGISLITRLSKNIKIAFDPDDAGVKASLRASRIALSLGMDVKIATPATDEDPADVIRRDPKAWKDILSESKGVVTFLVDSILKKTPNDLKRIRIAIRDEAFPFIMLMDKKTDRDRFVKEIHEKTGISETALWEDLKSLQPLAGNQNQTLPAKPRAVVSAPHRALGILALLSERGEAEGFVRKLKDASPADLERFESMSADEKKELAFEAEVLYDNADLEKNFTELVLHIEEGHLASLLEEKLALVHRAEKEKDVSGAKGLLRECSTISKRINEIKQSLRNTI